MTDMPLKLPCEIDVEFDPTNPKAVRWIKRQSELIGRCALYAVPRTDHARCIGAGLVEHEHFSHKPSPFGPAVGKIRYMSDGWTEQVYA